MQQGRTDSVRPSNDQDWLLKIKLFRVCSMRNPAEVDQHSCVKPITIPA
jgi:hypothetical protein